MNIDHRCNGWGEGYQEFMQTIVLKRMYIQLYLYNANAICCILSIPLKGLGNADRP